MGNITNPLRLKWKQTEHRYVVNFSGDQTGEYVSKEVAEELLGACQWALEQFKRLADQGNYPEFLLQENGGDGLLPLVKAIKAATNQI